MSGLEIILLVALIIASIGFFVSLGIIVWFLSAISRMFDRL